MAVGCRFDPYRSCFQSMNINTTITENDSVPPELWGRDHWSTLGYIECKLVDDSDYYVQFDPRMRQGRRHFRELSKYARPILVQTGMVMRPEHGSRLSDGTYLTWHDDWHCVQDMLDAGLFEGDPEEWDSGFQLKLSERGHAAAAALRKFKIEGGSFSECGPVVLEAMKNGQCLPAE